MGICFVTTYAGLKDGPSDSWEHANLGSTKVISTII